MRQGKREDRSCPPRLEELKKEAQGIMNPDIFDGARFEFNKTLTQKFQLNHNITGTTVQEVVFKALQPRWFGVQHQPYRLAHGNRVLLC